MTAIIQWKITRASGIVLAFVALGLTKSAFAWVYPEHRDIAILAIQEMDAARRAAFDRLWQDARSGDESRLCVSGADVEQGLAPSCIDWAALSGIAGDHSCSSAEMLESIQKSDWILAVADIAAQLKKDLDRIPVAVAGNAPERSETIFDEARRRLIEETNRAKRSNALRVADTRLQRADSKYATRADANLAHFLLSRPNTDLDPSEYAKVALRPGSLINAIGVYTWYHLNALEKASKLAQEDLSAEKRRAFARAALFDEAFALHFLQDTFAAGHIAGNWGDVSQRKGTHDFYNQNGLEVFTWARRDHTIVLMGDAHMRPEDRAIAAEAVRASLVQLLDATRTHTSGRNFPRSNATSASADPFDICANSTFPDITNYLGIDTSRYKTSLREVLLNTPVPGLGEGPGALPRARSELGTFAGLAASIEARGISGGFEQSQTDPGVIAGLDIGFRMGLGLEGTIGDFSDGLVFFQVGLHGDLPSSNSFDQSVPGETAGNVTAAIPARSGLSARVRMPYYLVPGDLLFMAPLYLIDREKYEAMAITASNGGLIGLQQGIATRFGRFQFVLGRELGVTFYGLFRDQELLAPPDHPGGSNRLVSYKTVNFDFPIVEYRPFRTFSSDQSSTLQVQLFGGVDVPYGQSVEFPSGAESVDLRPVWSIGLRLVFDWRHY
jgi:hypothetical protein